MTLRRGMTGRRSVRNAHASTLSSFTPQTILGTKLKLDLNSDVGIILGTGTRVSTWVDSSGSGNSCAQGTLATQPTRVLNVLDGHAAIRHSGVQYLEGLSFSGVAAGDKPRLYSVASWLGSGSFTGAILVLAGSATVNSGTYLTHYALTINAVANRSGSARVAQASSLTGQSSVPALFDGRNDSTDVVIRVNEVDLVSVGATSAGLTSTIDRYYVGVLEDKATQLLTGQTFRNLVVNPAPTAGEHADLIRYFKLAYPSLGLP
jgi:hypothetical protein